MQQTAPCRARLVHPILPRANDPRRWWRREDNRWTIDIEPPTHWKTIGLNCRGPPPPDCAACRKGTRNPSSIAIMMQAIIRCLRIRKPKPPRRQSLDDWHRTADAFKNLRATAAAARMRISHKPRCPEVGLGIPKPTSGHQEVPGLTSRSEVSRGQIRNS